MRVLNKFLLISGALVIVTSLFVRHLFTGGGVHELSSLKSVFPQAERFLPQKEPLPHYRALAKNWKTGADEVIGYCFDTAYIAPRVRGFGGPIHILVGMDLSGHLVGIKILEHNETPYFVKGFDEPWFSDQFVGKGLGDPLEIGQDLEGLSGATISARAVAAAVREGLATMAAAFSLTSKTQSGRVWGGTKWWFETAGLLGVMALSLVAFWRRKWKLRLVSLILGLGFLGFYLNSPLSVVHIVNLLSLHFPSFFAQISWYLIFFFGVTTALFVSRIYCGWLCPFGALQEFLKKVVPYRLRLSSGLHRRARYLRILLLWFILCLVTISGNQELLRYEPFATAFSLKGTHLMWISLIVILGASLVIDRFWCRYFCVVGAALHLLGRLGLRRRRDAASGSAERMGDF